MEDDSLFHEKAFFACYSASCLGSYTHMTMKNSRGITPHSRFSSTGEILLQSFLVNLICYGIEIIHCCISYICLAVVIIPNRKNLRGDRLLAHSFGGWVIMAKEDKLENSVHSGWSMCGRMSSYHDRPGTKVRQKPKNG